MTIHLPKTGLPPIPGDSVLFKVEVDSSRCGPPPAALQARLSDLSKNGFRTKLSRMVAFGGLHFAEAIDDVWGIGIPRARLATTWTVLAHWRPRAVDFGGEQRLVLTKRKNPNTQRLISEILGVGAGLLLARYIYERPYRRWKSLGHSRLDFESTDRFGANPVQVELRGRVNRQKWKDAIDQVHDKIAAGSSVASMAGIIFAPRTGRPVAPDFLFLDPPGPPTTPDSLRPLRDILIHYAPFFANQGLNAFADRLKELAVASDVEFDNYLSSGDKTLRGVPYYRTSFRLCGQSYLGTAWEGYRWPRFLVGPAGGDKGAFFDGLNEIVIDALRNGKVRDLLDMEIEEESGRDGRFVQIVLDDGRALSWAPTTADLMAHP